MKIRLPGTGEGTAQVVKFRSGAPDAARGDAADLGTAGAPEGTGSGPDGAAASAGDADDFRHRMWVNTAALVFTFALIAAGIWLAVSIADMRKTQDCVLAGRRNCAPITMSPS